MWWYWSHLPQRAVLHFGYFYTPLLWLTSNENSWNQITTHFKTMNCCRERNVSSCPVSLLSAAVLRPNPIIKHFSALYLQKLCIVCVLHYVILLRICFLCIALCSVLGREDTAIGHTTDSIARFQFGRLSIWVQTWVGGRKTLILIYCWQSWHWI